MIRVRVRAMPKRGVLDPQGEALARALHDLGHERAVREARVGRVMEIDLDVDDPQEARVIAERMCADLLINDVVERGEIELVDVAEQTRAAVTA